jgi:hypothetical protein
MSERDVESAILMLVSQPGTAFLSSGKEVSR